jgi:hypothetical protein
MHESQSARVTFICRAFAIALGLIVLLASVPTVHAQTRPGSLRVVVDDATDLPIPGAVVVATIEGMEYRALTNESGAATFDALPPGRYAVRIESPGFDPIVENVTIRAGARTNRDVTLQIAAFVDQVDVLPADADRQLANAFSTELSTDELQALPDDPDELAMLLQQLAGTDAEIRVDGFADGLLPSGTQVQSVVIRWDGGTSGGPRVEVRTQPGGDRWRTNLNARMRDETLNARNAFAPARPTGQTRIYSWSFNGPLVRNKTGVSFSIERANSMDQQSIAAAAPGGLFRQQIRQPNNRLGVWASVEHALTPAQRLRVQLESNTQEATNQGLGELDLPERAFTRNNDDGELRVSHSATLAREVVNDARFRFRWRNSEASPLSTDTAIRVNGAFSRGGAQQQGGRMAREYQIEDELLFTIGARHQITAGVNVDGGYYSGDEWRNANGTFTFADLAGYEAGMPVNYTQRLGDPSFSYSIYQFGAFVSENLRLRRNLVVNLGLRHEFQTHLGDWANLAPRFGVNWTPSNRTRTSLRAGYNVSFQPLQGSTYEQTILVNGQQQREVIIASPSYPDPTQAGTAGAQLAPGVIRADPALQMPFVRRVSFGLDQPLGSRMRFRANYSRDMGRQQFRSVDVNTPIGGVRPDTGARTITELRSIARTLGETLELNFSANFPSRRISGNATYRLGEQRNETDSPLQLPQNNFDLASDWGPSRQDIRHRFDLSMNAELVYGFRANGNFRLQSAPPYNVTIGVDTNGDGVTNERPTGGERNTARAAGSRNLDMTLTWGVGVGQRPVRTPPPGGRVANALGGAASRPVPRVRFEIYAQAANVLNDVNLQGFSGVQTSPFFGRATSAAPPRRVTLGFRVNY